MHVEQPALGDALGVFEQLPGPVAGDPAVLVGVHRQLLRLQMRDDDVVLPAGEEHRRPGVALSTGASAQLVVQPFGVVAPGADDMQATQFGHPLLLGGVVAYIGPTEPDVGTATGDLSGHGDLGRACRPRR